METSAIHRIVEHHAAMRGDVVAIAGNCQTVTYRDLNHRANHAARRLHAFGFHRGDVAFVRMPRSVDLAVVLLAVLKAGGSYAWATAAADEASLILAHDCDAGSPTIAVDVRALVTADAHAAPNLPIITRASDTACVLRDEPDGAAVLVPHVTVTALRQAAHTGRRHWRGDAGALDLLLLLIGGGTALLDRDPVTAAAA